MGELSRKTFENNLEKIGIRLTDRQYEQFNEYYRLLVEWNSFMNLTGITDYDEVLLKHYVDSLVFDINGVGEFENRQGKSGKLTIIDVGTGAGFPGLPLKIAHPQLHVVLLDSLNKRVNFLNEVIEKLGLEGIETIHLRAEDGGRDRNLRERFDVSVSRAVANLSTLAEYNLPFVKVGGYFVAYKSGDIDEEVKAAANAVKILGGKIEKSLRFTLPGTDIERSLVYIRKIKQTPSKYPRKAGLPSKEPIC